MMQTTPHPGLAQPHCALKKNAKKSLQAALLNVKGVLLRAVSTTAQQVKTRATRCKSEVTWGTLCSPAVDAAQLNSLQNIAVVE